MRWTVLVDNRTNGPALETEHGLSILLETEFHRILLDTGASDMFIRNAEYKGYFDKIYAEAYNNKSYTGEVIVPGKVYELSYMECSCPKVKCGMRGCPEQCECSRQSIIYILSQLEPNSTSDVQIVNTILRGSDRCTFRITRQ